MPLDQFIRLALLVIFSVNAGLVAVLVILKIVHRRRTRLHDIRRRRYLGLLSRHLSYENCTDPITEAMADDPAFLDALIDMQNAITGDEVATLSRIVNRHGVIERQVRHLDSSLLLGRRLRAAVALAEIGDDTVADALMRHLDDREPEIRIQCARGLGRIRWTPAIDQIVAQFGGEDPWVRARFSDTLVGFGTSATWPLLAYIRINHPFEANGPALALRTIAQIQDDEAVGPLIQILDKATDLDVRLATIEALGELASPEALSPLSEFLESDDWELRAKSATALGGLGDHHAIAWLMGALRDENWWVRRSAAAALAHLPAGMDALYEALDGEDRYAADAAAEALTDAGELVSARRRIETGISDSEPLLAHMENGAVA
jgi:HEAT repeat protein